MQHQARVGIIGCGGRVRSLAKDLTARYPAISIDAVCDPAPGAINAARDQLNPNARVCSDYGELCGLSELDWVMVGSWNAFHSEHAVAALQAGKHVFCEKPLATRIEDCLAIRDAHQASGRLFSFGLTLRYAGLYGRIYKLIREGAIGNLLSLEFNENLEFNHGGFIHADWRRLTANAGSHVLEKCCHDIDLANWFAGSLVVRAASFGGNDFFTPDNAFHVDRIGPNKNGQRAYATWLGGPTSPFVTEKDIVDNQVAILQYASGPRATFHTNCNAGIPERRMLLLGSEGAIRADLLSGTVEHRRIGWDQPSVVYNQTGGGHGDGDWHLIKNLAASMLSGELPRAGIVEGLTSAITCFGIDRAMASGECVDLRPLWQEAGMAPS